MISDNYFELGKTQIKISRVGIGIMQWGDVYTDRSDNSVNPQIQEIYKVSLAGGINFFDTAEMYGNGKSEIHLGRCLKSLSNEIVVATKFMPFPWRFTKGELRSALLRSLKRLGLTRVDLYQMHWPFPPVPISTWMDAMADAYADGLIRAVGVSNYSPSQTRRAYEALAKRNIPLASNQVRFSLLNRKPLSNGLVDVCRELAITIIAYSPLEKGILSGKYTPMNIPAGSRSWFYNKQYLLKIAPLMDDLRQIGVAHQGKTPAQVALNWLTCKSAVPIPGARNDTQAQENAGALGWQLDGDEVRRLDQISKEINK
jgi:aryl-alcohol dehydrogenase-like predicted oxidoreductase